MESNPTKVPKVSESALQRAIKKEHELARLHELSVYERNEVGYINGRFIQSAFPYTDTGETKHTTRNGNLSITIASVGEHGLPYGTYPRLVMIWLTMAVISNSQKYDQDDPERLKIHFGKNLAGFMKQLGITPRYGKTVRKDGKTEVSTGARLEEQMERLFNININIKELVEDDDGGTIETYNTLVSESLQLRWSNKGGERGSLYDSHVELSPKFFNLLNTKRVPIDLGILRQLKRSGLALDIFVWTSFRVSYARAPFIVTTEDLMRQFATRLDPGIAEDRRDFMAKFKRAVKKIHEAWPESAKVNAVGNTRLQVREGGKGIIVYPFPNPSVPRRAPRKVRRAKV